MFTALSAMVVAVTMTMPSVSVFWAEYSQELQDAYNWAYGKGVTTMSPIDNANMYGAITRAEMAKMLSVYSTEVLGNTPDTSKACTFTDIDSVKWDLHDFIIESCQLGIMGQGITAFRPYDTISRAEFGTALSRVLWGDKYEGGTPYYANHLNALKSAAIMNQIANAESTKEIRGYVMLMLMRSEGWSTVDCDEATIALACLDPENEELYKECPAACREDANKDEDGVVKSGDLAVEAKENKGAKVITDGWISELDTLTFAANENITLNSVTLERYGLSTSAAIASIWLEDEDWNEVTAHKSISTSKDTVTLSLKKDYKEIGKDASFIVVVETASGSASYLKVTNIGFKVTDVDSSAKNLDLSKYDANLYDFVDYSGNWVQVEFKGKTTDTTYNYEAWKFYDVAKMRVYATKAAVSINGFKLTSLGNLDLDDNVDEVEVLADGKVLKNVKFSVKNDELNISFDSQEIAINKNVTFTVRIALTDEFEDFTNTVRFWLEETTDLYVTETKNKVRVDVKPKVNNDSFYMPAKYIFNWAKITLTNTKLDKTIDAAQGSDDVKIAEGTIKIGGQAIRIKNLFLKPADHEDDITSVSLVINGDEYEATAAKSWELPEITIDEDSDVKILVDVESDADLLDEISFKIGAEWDLQNIINGKALKNAKYDSKTATVEDFVGTISISTLKIQEAKGSLKNDISSNKKDVTIEQSESNVELFKGSFTAKKQTAHLNNAEIKLAAGALKDDDSITFHVYIDGDEVATIDVDGPQTTTWTDNKDFSEVVVDAGKSVSVRVEADVYASDTTDSNIQFKLVLNGEDDNNNPITTSAVNFAKLAFVEAEGITVGTKSVMNQDDLILTDAGQTIWQFTVKPANKATKAELSTLTFDVTAYMDGVAGTTANADDYFTVKVGDDVIDDFSLTKNDDKWILSNTDIAKPIEWETNVNVTFEQELAQTTNAANPYVMTLTNANGSVNEPFKRIARNSIVRIVKQVKDGDYTKYTLNVDFADGVAGDTIGVLRISYDTGAAEDFTKVKDWDVVSVLWVKDTARTVKSIGYWATTDSLFTITNTQLPEFFKIPGTTDKIVAYSL